MRGNLIRTCGELKLICGSQVLYSFRAGEKNNVKIWDFIKAQQESVKSFMTDFGLEIS